MIYALQGKPRSPIKIGYSAHLETTRRRMATLQTGYPYTLRLIMVADGEREHEQRAHELLRAHRLRGEWFEAVGRVERFVRVCASDGIEAGFEAVERERRNEQPIRDRAGEIWLSETGATAALRLTYDLLLDARASGSGPPYVSEPRAGGRPHRIYKLTDLVEWLTRTGADHDLDWPVIANYARPAPRQRASTPTQSAAQPHTAGAELRHNPLI